MESRWFQNLASGKKSLGIALTFPSPELVEVFGLAGWDLVYASMHASRFTWDDIAHMARAAYRWGITPCARIPIQPWVGSYNPGLAVDAHHAFGLGCRVVIASVHDSREVAELIETQENEYHEISDLRIHELRTPAELDEWKKNIQQSSMVIPMVESLSAWADLDRVLAVPGLRAAFLGVGDMSRVLGVDRQLENPTMVDALKRFIDVSRSHSVAPIINTGYPEDMNRAWEITTGRAQWLFDLGAAAVFSEPITEFVYGHARRFALRAKKLDETSVGEADG